MRVQWPNYSRMFVDKRANINALGHISSRKTLALLCYYIYLIYLTCNTDFDKVPN